MADTMNLKVAAVLNEIADAVETGHFAKKMRIGLTILGSEHSPAELVKGAEMATEKYEDIEVVLIGEGVDTDLEMINASDLEECHKKMEEAFLNGVIDGCVTLHYNFPLGVSTVGRVITPGLGKEMIIATTTGTSETERVPAMVKNTIYGISAAKAIGIKEPTVGILNIDGANPTGRKLQELKSNGYEVHFAESAREDGGITMRGNDLLQATCDVMVCDTLTGNLLMKVFSSFTTGGSYESSGYGYGPGLGEGYEPVISIISRASGAPVICGAIRYNADAIKGNVKEVLNKELQAAKKAGLEKVLTVQKKETAQEAVAPPKKVVSEQIAGIDILEIEDAKNNLWAENIYAETGMGCTGPIIIVSPEDLEAAKTALRKAEFIN